MNQGFKNRLLIWLVVLLMIANAGTIAMFWIEKSTQPMQPKGTPKDFLINELRLDSKQQEQLDILVKEHQLATKEFRQKTRTAKESFFGLLKQANVSDSVKQATAKKISVQTEALDIITLNHFQKIRDLCNREQQKKFDEILQEITTMIGQPQPPIRRDSDGQGMPPGEPSGKRPPPPQN